MATLRLITQNAQNVAAAAMWMGGCSSGAWVFVLSPYAHRT